MSSAVAWPRVTTEERLWTPSISPALVSRSVRARHAGPYRAAVLAPVADRTPAVPAHVAALADDATAEIARFDAETSGELAPFTSVLLRSESASSSMIENLTSGAKQIAMAELGSRDKSNASQIADNVAAMTAALDLADRLDGDAVLAMHAALMRRHDPAGAGRWRTEQVWIGGDSFGPHGAAFTPPHHEHVAGAMDDLIAFTRRTDLPLLLQAAVAHAQFETVHPFTDGNGRTGRALVHATLRGHGLTRRVTVPVSAGLLTDTRAYIEALTAYREGDPSPIVEQLAGAALIAVANARRLVEDLQQVRAGWVDQVSARRDSSTWRLVDLLLRQPVVDAETVARELGMGPNNALRPVTALVSAGVLTEFTGHRRNRMWQARQVLDALDDFAVRAGRRTAG